MASKGRQIQETPRILVIADAVAQTGFSRVNHSIFDRLYKKYDVHILGVNYFGDPHKYPYKIYPAAPGGDVFGLGRVEKLLQGIQPHIVFIINDPWLVKDYLDILVRTPVGKLPNGQHAFSHLAAYIPIDGKNIPSQFATMLNKLNCLIGYTQFGIDELRKSGTTTHAEIVPHGIDTSLFKPQDKKKARARLKLEDDWFIVGCCNRN